MQVSAVAQWALLVKDHAIVSGSHRLLASEAKGDIIDIISWRGKVSP